MNNKKRFCVFDLDGTLDLTKTNLYTEICMLHKRGMEFVVATGRTNQYVIDSCKKYGIIQPRFIIADNGGTVFDNRQGIYIKKMELNPKTRKRLLDEYIQIGGILEEVRYTDGEKVYAVESKSVRKYYEGDNIIEYKSEDELLEAILSEETSITKVTLAGSKKRMKQIVSFIKEKGIECWSDIGTTKFPSKIRGNYRLDVMGGEASKGEALSFLIDYTGIRDFTCIGNGLNDLSMFKLAIDKGMPIFVVRNFEDGKTSSESEALIKIMQDYINEVKGDSRLLNIKDFPINSYLNKLYGGETLKDRRTKFFKSIKASIKSQGVIHSNINHRVQERGK